MFHSSADIKDAARHLAFAPESRYVPIQKLLLDGFFDAPVSSGQLVVRIREKFGKRWPTKYVQTYMQKFMDADLIYAVRPNGHNGNYWVLSSVTREQALADIGKSKRVRELEADLFSAKLLGKLKKGFSHELDELHDNFGKNGNCTAFLLRKILEKLIVITFTKNGREVVLEDKSKPGGWIGLHAMIEAAAREKLHGIAFLTGKTANEIKGIKFLGDTAAHNPLATVDMRTIVPQMPYIITAYEELAGRL